MSALLKQLPGVCECFKHFSTWMNNAAVHKILDTSFFFLGTLERFAIPKPQNAPFKSSSLQLKRAYVHSMPLEHDILGAVPTYFYV